MKFSVIIPAYNAELYLKRCIDSVIHQDFDDFEVIVINDGSTDGTLDILLSLYGDNDKIVVVNKDNAGVSAARNNGLKIARGDYIVFLDSDDWIENGYFNYLNSLFKSCDCCGIVLGHIKDNGKLCEKISRFNNESTINGEEYRNMFISGVITNNPWDKVFKRSVYIDNEIFFPEEIKMGEDAVVSAKLGVFVKKVCISGRHFVHYMQNTNGVTKKQIKIEHICDLDNALTKIIQSYSGLVSDVLLSHMYVLKIYNLVSNIEYNEFKYSPYYSKYLYHVNRVSIRDFRNKRDLVKYYPLYILSKFDMLACYRFYDRFFIKMLKVFLVAKDKG